MAHTGYQISYSLNLLDSQTYGASKQWLKQGLARVLCGAWDVWLQKLSTLFFLPALLAYLGQERGRRIPEEKVRPSGRSLGIAKGWGFLKAFFLNWAGFFNKGPAPRTGFYLLTKRQREDRGKHSILCSGMPGCCGRLLLSVLQGKFWICWQTFPSFTYSSGTSISAPKVKMFFF